MMKSFGNVLNREDLSTSKQVYIPDFLIPTMKPQEK